MKNSTNFLTGSKNKVGDGDFHPSPQDRANRKAACLPALLLRLLQEGVLVETIPGINVKDFLMKRLGLECQYISTRLATMFLDGAPVEDLQNARLREGSVLALSAAMPGLAGSIFRRGGHLAALRSRIEIEKESGEKAAQILVKLKLFNSLIPELAEGILQKGVWLRSSALTEDFLKNGSFSVELDGSSSGKEEQLVRLSLRAPLRAPETIQH